jgi:hypothetical protein
MRCVQGNHLVATLARRAYVSSTPGQTPMCTQLAELERALQIASVRRKTAQTAMANQAAYIAAHDSMREAAAEIADLESEIEQHVATHGCRVSADTHQSPRLLSEQPRE